MLSKDAKQFKSTLRSKDSQVTTQLVLWIFILFKVTRWQHVSASFTRPFSGHK